jgi:hypothetical protein
MKTKLNTYTFDNHPPLRTKHEAECQSIGGGGTYHGVGYHNGLLLPVNDRCHFWTEHSSGCDYGGGGVETITYHGSFTKGDYAAAAALLKSSLGCQHDPSEGWTPAMSELITTWDTAGHITIPTTD